MPYRTPRWRIAFGIVVSLLLHATAVVFLRLPEPRAVADPRSWLTQVEVRIVTPAPPPPPMATEPEATTAAAPARAAAEPRRRQRERQPARQLAARPAKEGTLTLYPAHPGQTGPGKSFDREAAKAAARGIAADLAPAPAQYSETRDEQLARQIQNAARPNCKDGIPGGLLAPLILLMDKKDSGCKW